MKKLKQEYRRIKDKGNKTGEAAKESWRINGALNDILWTKPATKPLIVIDTLEDEESDNEGRGEAANSDGPLASTSTSWDDNTGDPEQVIDVEAQSSKEESEKKN